MKKGVIIGLLSVLWIGLLMPPLAYGAEEQKRAKVLVIYTTDNQERGEAQKHLDMLIGHFTDEITFVSSDEVKTADLDQVTHLFYYGQAAVQLPEKFTTLLDSYTGTFVAMGYNSDQLGEHFQFITPLHENEIEQLQLSANPFLKQEVHQEVIDIKLAEEVHVLIEGKKADTNETVPVMVQEKDHYFYGIDMSGYEENKLFGEVLHDVFDVQHTDENPAYIRLEDVHPLVDQKNVEEIAKILKEKEIPYMIAVIPVYTDPATGREYHFSDNLKLLKTLKQMQKDGASIVLHGYTHQFRDSETGEGFEFWDVENNTPIYAPAHETFQLKKEEDFASASAYETYIDELKAFERAYTETKLEAGIHELVNYGLYPLAFEAPHYTMSQHGYKIVSEYFSTYVGQIQLSDEDWEVMDSTLYVTTPSFLHGMEVLPETIGYVKPDDNEAIPEMIANADSMSETTDGVVSGFYHPYLGVESFEALLSELESTADSLSWIDLKERDITVQTSDMLIYTEDGTVKMDGSRGKLMVSSKDFLLYHFFRWSNMLAWALCFIGASAVIAFMMFTVLNKRRKIAEEGAE